MMTTKTTTPITRAEWIAEGERLFGANKLDWKFVCPACGHVASIRDYKEAGAPVDAVGFSCVGRWTGANDDAWGGKVPGPCNYAGGGLIRMNPVQVYIEESGTDIHQVFAFATPRPDQPEQ